MDNSNEEDALFVFYKINKCGVWKYENKPDNCSSWYWVGAGGTQFVNLPREEQFSGDQNEKISMIEYLFDKFNNLQEEGFVEEYCFFDKYPLSEEDFQNNRLLLD